MQISLSPTLNSLLGKKWAKASLIFLSTLPSLRLKQVTMLHPTNVFLRCPKSWQDPCFQCSSTHLKQFGIIISLTVFFSKKEASKLLVSNFRIKIGLSDSQKIIYCLPSGRIIHALKTEESNFHYKPQILVLSNLVFFLVYDSEHTVRLKKKKLFCWNFLLWDSVLP